MLEKISNFIFFLSLFEIFIGGGGNFFKYSGISLRMVFFGLNMFFFAIYVLKKSKFNITLVYITLLFIILHILSTIIGIYNDAPLEYLKANFQGSLIFILLPYYAFKINSIEKVEHIYSLIKKSAIVLVIFHFLFMYILKIKLFDFNYIYAIISQYQDIKFRDEQFFFYSGFIYICIGILFFIKDNTFKNKIISIILFISVIATLTRGFIFFTAFVVSLYYFILSKNVKMKLYLIILGILFSIFIIPFLAENRSERSKYISDDIRIQTNNEVIKNTNISSFLLGHGFGKGVSIRPVFIENSFIDIFYKQGIIGLAFWFFLFFYLSYKTYLLKKNIYFSKGVIFWLSTMFIYLQSFSNPFVNNTIGIPFIMLSISSLLIYKKSRLI